ncbi:unnamed protein product [Mytilus edulis]|uniref:Uncharacterized protein n=1 Tax=Mytilus edulis TaxID=6550 RepID=A0A8S3RWW6_MYTED|nr:unnamed protein product [Mytilus edulis]
MINLLQTIGNKSGGDSRQAQSDTSVSTMLSNIITIHNAAAKNDEGKLTNEQLEQNWDDIGQAILKLVSSRIIDVDSDEEKGQLIGRIFALNPMDMDVKKLCIVVDLSDNDPVSILRDSINEYCTSKKDGLSVKREHIPKSSYLPHRTYRTRKFTDITSNENNFLVVVHGITTIVYSVIKNEFRTKCSGRVLKHEDQKMRTDRAEKLQKHFSSTESESVIFKTTNSISFDL